MQGAACETQLLEAIYDLSYNLNAGIQTDLLFLDSLRLLIKRLLSKLSFYGINGQLYTWIENFD